MYLDDEYSNLEEDQIFEFTIEDGLLGQLKLIEPLVVEVIGSNERLFSAFQRVNGSLTFKSSSTGTRLLKILTRGQNEYACYFPTHELNPYIELLFSCARKFNNPLFFSSFRGVRSSEVMEAVEALNGLVATIRQAASAQNFKSLVRGFSKASNKRSKSLDAYIDALFEKHSRLVVIRLDLSYESNVFHRKQNLQDSMLQVKQDWARMQRDLHKGVPIQALLGFACKLEYGSSKGFHFHLLVFYDGATYRKDVALAKLLGEHWKNTVTTGSGRYFNCNNQASKYRYPGVGIISYFDTDIIKNLKGRVASYLAKVDYWVRFSPECGRAFFRANMPKLNSVKKGRPRSFSV